MNLSCAEVLPLLKSDFGSLWHCKERGASIEIISPFSTATDQFVSVFITQRDGNLVATDGGFLYGAAGEYQIGEHENLQAALGFFAEHYGLSYAIQGPRRFYYKSAAKPELLSAAVYDICNFICAVVSCSTLPLVDESDIQRSRFRREARTFLSERFAGRTDFNVAFPGLKTVKFNAAILLPHRGGMAVVNYITGSDPRYFQNEVCRTCVHFELAEERLMSQVKERVALLDDTAEGFESVSDQMALLREKSTLPPVRWSERRELIDSLK